jgi:monoterpene epsilon-lactone hydrolase
LPSYPALDDLAGWRAMVAAIDGQILAAMTAQAGASTDAWADTEPVHVGADVFVITPPPVDDADQRVYLDVHGGAMILRGGQLCRADQIIVGGSSAGANLAAAMILRARDEGLPLPAAAILLTPHLDLTESGDTFRTNLGIDTVLPSSLMPVSLLYAGGADLAHPYLSPLFGDFSRGFPPTLLAGGTRDLLLSNAVRMHRSLRDADVPAELHVLEAAQHGLMPRTPEGESLARDVRKFISAHCPPRAP